MKVGDTVPVQIGGHIVAQARIKEMTNEQATLIVPATMVVMGIRTSLEDVPEVPQDTSGTETVITGVDRTNNDEPVAVPSATVDENVTSSHSTNESTTQEVSAPEQVETSAETPSVETVAETPVVAESPPSENSND